MKKSEIFAAILKMVSDETDVPEQEIMSKNRQTDIVDARHILVKSLHDYGFYPVEISQHTGMSHRAVNHIITNFDCRMTTGQYIRNSFARIRKCLGNNSFTS